MKKKAVFFTLVAILASTILFIAFSPDDYAAQSGKTDVVKDRITKADNFVRTIDQSYIERALKHSTYSALRAMILYETRSGTFFNNSNFDCNFETITKTGEIITPDWNLLDSDTWFNTSPDLGSNDGGTTEDDNEPIGNTTIVAQLFIPSKSGNLENATFKIQWVGQPRKNVTVELRDSVCDAPGNQTLDVAIIEPPSTSGWGPPRIAEFPNKPYIYEGKKYYFVFKAPEKPEDDKIRLRTTTEAFERKMYSYDTPTLFQKIDEVLEQPIMLGNTLEELLDKISAAAKRILYLDTEFNIINISIYQNNDTAHWFVGVDLNISYTINASIANWEKQSNIKTLVSIIGLNDSYYYISNNGVSNIIENEIDGVSTDYITENHLWNVTYLKKHIAQRTYKKESNAPSFLMRLRNNTNSSECCGIESMIHHVVSRNMTYVDYCFWGTCPGSVPGGNYSLYNVTEIGNGTYPFKLELYHLGQYNITENITWSNFTFD